MTLAFRRKQARGPAEPRGVAVPLARESGTLGSAPDSSNVNCGVRWRLHSPHLGNTHEPKLTYPTSGVTPEIAARPCLCAYRAVAVSTSSDTSTSSMDAVLRRRGCSPHRLP